MKKVKWQHPSAHKADTWVEAYEFEDKEGVYLAKSKDAPMKIYLKDNKEIKIIYEKN